MKKHEVQVANLSVPSPGNWTFLELYFVSDHLLNPEFQHVFEKMDLKWLLKPNCQVEKHRIPILKL